MKTKFYAAAWTVALIGLIPCALHAQVTVTDDFTQAAAAVSWVPFNGACLTAGNNTVTFDQDSTTYTVKGFHAQAGYSLVDGVGTVNGWYLAYELAGQTPPS